jgi:hypothetical protein
VAPLSIEVPIVLVLLMQGKGSAQAKRFVPSRRGTPKVKTINLDRLIRRCAISGYKHLTL